MPATLEQYCNLVRTANQTVNLVSRQDIDQLYAHHVVPSRLFLELQRVRPGETVLDIGSGGGFPGMVIAIMEPTIQVTLVDSIGKKTKFLRHCVAELGLNNVTVVTGRVETVSGQYDHVTARAVAPLDTLWSWASPLLKPTGTLETLKGAQHAAHEVQTVPVTAQYTIIQTHLPGTVIVSVSHKLLE
ncbi:MAG: 16S rRNA (guanine(527)-N(7))-methyltransferase RsmG [Candidatus Kerfeldbacteria bacterium]|nr:16S rRNA (guanine(527)-N(7))-methyltransferase RsmG [Candidatus Kerfeldbacteria bacterium]